MSETALQRPPHHPLVAPGEMDLHAKDMTATFSAECPLRYVQWKLAEAGQWLPVDGDPDATLGRLVETNSTGPLRLGFGGWRDLLLGAQFTNGKGELITAGGRTVKNVAGYDLTKFMVGGHGIFGRLVTVTTRTHRRPDGALIAHFPRDVARFTPLLTTPLRPQWAMLSGPTLLCGYLGDEPTLAWYEANLPSLGPIEAKRWTLEEEARHRTTRWSTYDQPSQTDGGVTFRASVPPARLHEFFAGIAHVSHVADPAFGVVIGRTLHATDPDRVRAATAAVGGRVRFGSSAATLDVSTNPAERQIIERLKAAFDPDNRLNPLPWQRR
jgi:FAD/FMN-containing dehydrogenase